MRMILSSVVALTVLAGFGAAAQTAHGETIEADTFDASALADGYDYDYRWNGSGYTLITRANVGTLSTGMSAAAGPNTNGLSLMQTVCFNVDTSKSKGRHCWRKYKPTNGDSDPTYKYRLWWVKGSATAKSGRKLMRVRDQVRATTGSMIIVDWSPAGTQNVGSCFTNSASLSASFAGFSVSIGSSFTSCPNTYGLDYIGNQQFRIKWAGRRAAGSYIGMGGGALYRLLESASTNQVLWWEHVTCAVGASGC
jgi:hypothetical protein